MAIKEVDLGNVRGDINDSQATFTQANTRTNIESGEKGSVIFGKIKKWFADLGTAAFCSVANNTTTTTGNTVLDGRMGKTLQTGIDNLGNRLNAANLSLTNSTYYPTTYVIVCDRVVQIRIAGFVLKDVPVDAELLLGTLPAAYCPPYQVIKYVFGGNTTSRLFRLAIESTGKVTLATYTAIPEKTGININETFIAKAL